MNHPAHLLFLAGIALAAHHEQCQLVPVQNLSAKFSDNKAYHSKKHGHTFSANLVFDGVGRDGTSGKTKMRSFAMAYSNKASLDVTLAEMVDIAHVDIYPRTDNTKALKRYKGLKVSVGEYHEVNTYLIGEQVCTNDQCQEFDEKCLKMLVESSEPIRFTCGVRGKHIRIENSPKSQLQVAELDVVTCSHVEATEGCCENFQNLEADVSNIRDQLESFELQQAKALAESSSNISKEDKEILSGQIVNLQSSVMDLGINFEGFSSQFFHSVKMVENLANGAFEQGVDVDDQEIAELSNKLAVLESNLDNKLSALATLDLGNLEKGMSSLKEALDTNVKMDNQRVMSTNAKIADYDQKFQGMVAELYRRFGKQMTTYSDELGEVMQTEKVKLKQQHATVKNNMNHQLQSMVLRLNSLEHTMLNCQCSA